MERLRGRAESDWFRRDSRQHDVRPAALRVPPHAAERAPEPAYAAPPAMCSIRHQALNRAIGPRNQRFRSAISKVVIRYSARMAQAAVMMAAPVGFANEIR